MKSNAEELPEGWTWTARPCRAFYVRRRTKPQGTVLIHLNRTLAVTERDVRLWRVCDGRRSLWDVHREVSSIDAPHQQSLDTAQLAESLSKLHRMGFVQRLPPFGPRTNASLMGWLPPEEVNQLQLRNRLSREEEDRE